MSLNPPLQTSGSTAPDSRPDPELLLLEAVRQRQSQECLDRLQRCVHRRGLDWLQQFQLVTLPALEGAEAAAWFGALLACPPAEPAGDGEQRWIEQRAAAAVDGAIASMLVAFPELLAPGPALGFGLPLALAPPAGPMPEVLPGRTPPPVFSFTAPGLSPLGMGDSAQESLAARPSGSDGPAPCSKEIAFETSSSAVGLGGEPVDRAPFDQASVGSAAPGQRSAVEIAVGLGSGLLRRLSRTDWRSLARARWNRDGFPPRTDSAVSPQPLFPVAAEIQAPPEAPAAAAGTAVPASGGDIRPRTPDPLAEVVRLAERCRAQETQADAAPAPQALAELRAWLPDSSLPRAS